MNYYEELGVSRSASVDEIRNSYKRLARLFHPDFCVEHSARPLAESKMKRLNAMVSTLIDPAKRERYDLQLAALAVRPTRAAIRPPVRIRQFCGVAVAALLLIILFLHVEDGSRTDAAPVQLATAAPAAIPAPRTARPARTRPRRVRNHWQAVKTSIAVIETSPEIPPPVTLRPMVHTAPVISIESSLPPAAGTVQPTLTGDWLFVPSQQTSTNGMYPPEYIELHLTESSGMLRGRYRARYRIADRAICPNVVFQFEGPDEQAASSLAWSGMGNAKGRVTLRLLSTGLLEVSWIAEQLGTEMGLISGTATLVRKLD